MYKIIGGDKNEYGPATADEMRHWIAEGRLSGQSLVWAEGSPEWKPLAAFPEFADALQAQVVHAPGAGAPAPPANAGTLSAQVLGRQPEVRVGRCLALSWELMTANFGLLFGATLLVWFIALLCQFVPIIGPLVYWVLQGVFYGGLYLIFLKRIRGKPAAVGDVFAGFSLAFAQLMLAGLVSSLVAGVGLFCCVVPGVYLFVAWIFSVPLVADKGLEFWSAMESSRKTVSRVWFPMFGLVVVAFAPFILTYILVEVKVAVSMFTLLPGLVGPNPPDFAHMMQVIAQVAKENLIYVMLIKLVLLLNLPFALGALMYAYEDLFGARTTPAS